MAALILLSDRFLREPPPRDSVEDSNVGCWPAIQCGEEEKEQGKALQDKLRLEEQKRRDASVVDLCASLSDSTATSPWKRCGLVNTGR